MLRYIAFAAVLVASVSAGVIQPKSDLGFSDCTGTDAGLGYIFTVSSPNISAGADIILKKGGTYEFTIQFEASGASNTLKPVIYGIIGGIKVPWNGAGTNACTNLVGTNKCPLKDKGVYTYTARITVLAEYPAVSLTFQWSLVGDKGSQICFTMPAKITA